MFGKLVKRLCRQDHANTVTEYAVMLSLIVIASLGAITALSNKIVVIFEAVAAIE